MLCQTLSVAAAAPRSPLWHSRLGAARSKQLACMRLRGCVLLAEVAFARPGWPDVLERWHVDAIVADTKTWTSVAELRATRIRRGALPTRTKTACCSSAPDAQRPAMMLSFQHRRPVKFSVRGPGAAPRSVRSILPSGELQEE